MEVLSFLGKEGGGASAFFGTAGGVAVVSGAAAGGDAADDAAEETKSMPPNAMLDKDAWICGSSENSPAVAGPAPEPESAPSEAPVPEVLLQMEV